MSVWVTPCVVVVFTEDSLEVLFAINKEVERAAAVGCGADGSEVYLDGAVMCMCAEKAFVAWNDIELGCVVPKERSIGKSSA